MIKIKIFKIINLILKEYLGLASIILIVSNFIIWHTSIEIFSSIQYKIFNYIILTLLSGLLLNLHHFDFKSFVKDNFIFLIIIALSIYNSTNLIVVYKNYTVDMSFRTKELIIGSLPQLLLIAASLKLNSKHTFIISFVLVLLLITFYSVLPLLYKFKEIESILGFDITYTWRASSLLNNPNALGEFIFLGIFIILFLSIISNNIFLKIIFLLPTSVLAYTLFLTQSETAIYMTVILVLSLLIYFLYYSKKNKYFVLMLLTVFILSGLFLYVKYYDIFFGALINSGLSGREKIWANTLEIIRLNNKYGVGYGNFTFAYHEMFGTVTSPHNMIFGIFTELGIMGLGLVLLWFVYIIVRNHNKIITNKNHTYNKYLIMFNIFYITFFIGQLTEFAFLKVQTIFIFFLVVNAFNNLILTNYRNDNKKVYVNSLIIIPVLLIPYIILEKPLEYSEYLLFTIVFAFITFILYLIYEVATKYLTSKNNKDKEIINIL